MRRRKPASTLHVAFSATRRRKSPDLRINRHAPLQCLNRFYCTKPPLREAFIPISCAHPRDYIYIPQHDMLHKRYSPQEAVKLLIGRSIFQDVLLVTERNQPMD